MGLLSIYRLNKDNIIVNNVEQEVDGTVGWVITGLAGVGYRLNTHTAVKFLFGKKIISREFNPDGLSREYVSTLSIEWRF